MSTKGTNFQFSYITTKFQSHHIAFGEIHQLIQIGWTLYVEFAFLVLLFYPNMVYSPIL